VSLYDYRVARDLLGYDIPFYALIMAAMRQADTTNAGRLCDAFPDVWDELLARYMTPAGRLDTDPPGRSESASHQPSNTA